MPVKAVDIRVHWNPGHMRYHQATPKCFTICASIRRTKARRRATPAVDTASGTSAGDSESGRLGANEADARQPVSTQAPAARGRLAQVACLHSKYGTGK